MQQENNSSSRSSSVLLAKDSLKIPDLEPFE